MALTILSMMMMAAVELPMGSAPAPVALPHFPDRLHALVWRNWQVLPMERLAEAVGAHAENLRAERSRGGALLQSADERQHVGNVLAAQPHIRHRRVRIGDEGGEKFGIGR